MTTSGIGRWGIGGSLIVLAAWAAGACTVSGRGMGSVPIPNDPGTPPEVDAAPAAPVVLATGQGYPAGIAADDSRVYWANWKGGDIASVGLDGAAPTKLVTGVHPHHLRVDANNVYWTDSEPNRGVDEDVKNGSIMSAPKTGGKPNALVTGLGSPDSIAIDATTVYFTDDLRGTVSKVPIAGGAATILAQGLPELGDLQVDATHVYWVSGGSHGGPGRVSRLDKNGGTPVVVAEGAYLSLGLGPGGVYFRKKDELWHANVDGQNQAKIELPNTIRPGVFQPRAFGTADTSVFVLGRDGFSSDSPFAIYEIPTGGAPKKVAEKFPEANPGEVAANQGGVYLIDGTRGTVTRFPR